ncbi:hypothetical protein CRENPOLYSF2_3150016 [Crenothrix polyspora]|uniref:PIN domain-containing protein n=1 Tax=Crenothrix polyspora TaxID=360316 RepID=A0A1R4HAM1_9GAMM|nr:PIN domain-containing protein [Crenothrix polyspora]SJM93216.1 hypothetical protein CRENPOLYSF2_3150016 [Crenothrix polyspora]
MPYLLDTNAAIALMKEHPQLLSHVRRVGRSALWICAPVEAELWFGVAKSTKQEQNRARLFTLLAWLPSLPFRDKQHDNLAIFARIWPVKVHPLARMICRLPLSRLLTI